MRERKGGKSQTFPLSPNPPCFYPSPDHLLCHQSAGLGQEPTNSPPQNKANMLQNVCTVFQSSCRISLGRVPIHGGDHFPLYILADSMHVSSLLLHIGQRLKTYQVEQNHSKKTTSSVQDPQILSTCSTDPSLPFPDMTNPSPLSHFVWMLKPSATLLPTATSTGSELAGELRPICHSGSNGTKMKHQKQQTGTNLSFPRE